MVDIFDYTKDKRLQDIKTALNSMGISCYEGKTTEGASVVTYNFFLGNISDYNKLERAMKPLSAFLRCKCRLIESTSANFAVEVERIDRKFYELKDYAKELDKYTFVAGIDQNGNTIKVKLDDLPHLLIAGQTGAGKSMCLNSILVQLFEFNTPDDIEFVLLDGKEVELSEYKKLKQYAFNKDRKINDEGMYALIVCGMLVKEMDRRYSEMAMQGKRKYEGKHIVLVADELDNLLNGEMTKYYLKRLAQQGRAANIHLILATQRPVVKVITGDIQANIPSRIALTTASARDSVIILGHKGAEALRGKGDALLRLPKVGGETHIQCLTVTENDVYDYIQKRLKENK